MVRVTSENQADQAADSLRCCLKLLPRHLGVKAWSSDTAVSAHLTLAAVVTAPGLSLASCLVASEPLSTQTRMHLNDQSTYLVESYLLSSPRLYCSSRVRRRVHCHRSQLDVVRSFVKSLRRCATASELLASELVSFRSLRTPSLDLWNHVVYSDCFLLLHAAQGRAGSTDMIHLVLGLCIICMHAPRCSQPWPVRVVHSSLFARVFFGTQWFDVFASTQERVVGIT